ncbi:hypothetical protein Tco_0716273 [Tanacetum coccineum]
MSSTDKRFRRVQREEPEKSRHAARFGASVPSSVNVEHILNDQFAKDCLDFEASRARGFCPSITRASNPQLHLGNPIS